MDDLQTPDAALAEAIKILEGPSNTARVLQVPGQRHQTVQGWRRTRVPAKYCPLLERETRARGRVIPCEALRPDIEWSVVRNSHLIAQQGAA